MKLPTSQQVAPFQPVPPHLGLKHDGLGRGGRVLNPGGSLVHSWSNEESNQLRSHNNKTTQPPKDFSNCL